MSRNPKCVKKPKQNKTNKQTKTYQEIAINNNFPILFVFLFSFPFKSNLHVYWVGIKPFLEIAIDVMFAQHFNSLFSGDGDWKD